MDDTELTPISLDEAMKVFDDEPTDAADAVSEISIDEAMKVVGED